MSANFPPAAGGSAANRERTGDRKGLVFSDFARSVEGVTSGDIDHVFWADSNRRPVAFVEVTTDPGPKPTTWIRTLAGLASQLGYTYAVLVKHRAGDDVHEAPVQVAIWKCRDGKCEPLFPEHETTWGWLQDALTRMKGL